MNKLLRSCIIILGAFFILAVTKTASSQSVEFGISTPVFKVLIGNGIYDRYGYDCYGYDRYGYDRRGYDRYGNYRYERHDYDRDDHRGDRDHGDRYEKHEKPVKHEKAYDKRR